MAQALAGSGWSAGCIRFAVDLALHPIFSRYIRHDILVIAWTLLAMVALFRYLAIRFERDLILLVAVLGLMLRTMERSFSYMAIIVGFLLLTAIAKYGRSWLAWSGCTSSTW